MKHAQSETTILLKSFATMFGFKLRQAGWKARYCRKFEGSRCHYAVGWSPPGRSYIMPLSDIRGIFFLLLMRRGEGGETP